MINPFAYPLPLYGTTAIVAFAICLAGIHVEGRRQESRGEPTPDSTPWTRATIAVLFGAMALFPVALFAQTDQRGDAWTETAEVVPEKAVEKYGDVFAHEQFDQPAHLLAEAKVWQIAGEPLVCAADVTGHDKDPGAAEVTVLCGGTELPRVDDTEKS